MGCTPEHDGEGQLPARGMFVRDKRGTGEPKIGRVMEVGHARVWLRPLGGGREWTAPLADVEPVPTSEALRPLVAEANRLSARGRAEGPAFQETVLLPELTCVPNRDEGAPTAIYSVVCLLCGAPSEPVDNEPMPVHVWMLTHTGVNPDHCDFKATTETFWRVNPAT